MLTSCLSQGCLKCASELREEHRRRNSQTRGRSDHTCTKSSVAGFSFNTVTNQIHVTTLPNSLTCHMPGQTWSSHFKMWCLGAPLIGANILAEHATPIFRVEEWMRCLFYPADWRGSFIQNTDNYLPNYTASHLWRDLTSLLEYSRSWRKISSTVHINVEMLQHQDGCCFQNSCNCTCCKQIWCKLVWAVPSFKHSAMKVCI